MLADGQADDHQRNGDADRERRLTAVDAAFGRALVLRQLDRQRHRLGLADDEGQQVLAPGQDQDEQEGRDQPERISGSTTSNTVRQREAPRISAACSISRGTSSMKLLVIQIA